MIDFTPIARQEKTIAQVASELSFADLHQATGEMFDIVLNLIVDADDADVVFQPVDQNANDPAAATEGETNIAWTLGHVIVHLTASFEEAAALGAEMARGIPFHGRSRYEVDWESVTTIEQVRQRLEESRRMSLAGLAMWPDQPNLELSTEVWPGGPVLDARGRHLLGLLHAADHLGQITDIVQQAKAAK